MTKDYDLGREWLDFRLANRLRHDFLATPLEDRPAALQTAVDGGSVPDQYIKELERHCGPDSALVMEVDAEIDDATVEVDPHDGAVMVGGKRFTLVILATGTQLVHFVAWA